MKFEIQKGDGAKRDPNEIPTKFKRYVHRKGKRRGKLNELSSSQKLIAALTKALAIQGKRDRQNYYIHGDSVYCKSVTATGEDGKMSVSASGRFTIGKVGDNLTRGTMEFDIKFRDSKDEMGLPDLIIESASMEELPRGSTIQY